jgi:succinate dehydrogenase/fumarate reductase flavoprotein subunit
LQKQFFKQEVSGARHYSAAPPTNTGDGVKMGLSAAGQVDTEISNAAAWVPVSRIKRRDGTVCHFPHLVDRGRPGVIAVNLHGERFASESSSYHDFMQGLFKTTPEGQEPVAFIVADRRAQRRFGLGFSKPFPFPLRPHLKSGYLASGNTVEELAEKLGLPCQTLAATVDRFNGYARTGKDLEFQRGETVYEAFMGDESSSPNPCMAPLEAGPFYAVRVEVGSLGTFSGLKTDAQARVLDGDAQAIPGLYAIGNDMASIMSGRYPAGGITLGPAMTFGYIAALSLAGSAGRHRSAPCDAPRCPSLSNKD